MAGADTRSQVRIAAIKKLVVATDSVKMATLFRQIAEKDFAYSVVGAAMKATNKVAPKDAIELARTYANVENSDILGALADIYAKNPSAAPEGFFEKNLTNVDGQNAIEFIGTYGKMLSSNYKADPNFDIVSKLNKLKGMATNPDVSLWKRFGSTKALYEIYKKLDEKSTVAAQVKIMIDEIKEKETNDQLKAAYSAMFGLQP
jgi:hypothetical protein